MKTAMVNKNVAISMEVSGVYIVKYVLQKQNVVTVSKIWKVTHLLYGSKTSINAVMSEITM